MSDAIAYFLTIPTYGSWLPGDERGWIEYHNGWQPPNPNLEIETAVKMSERMKVLSSSQRKLVEQQVRDTCVHRGWTCHAVNCRTNHMHAVISAHDTSPKKVRTDLKAWCTRKLKEDALPENMNKWWASRGSIRIVADEDELARVIRYTLEEQEGRW